MEKSVAALQSKWRLSANTIEGFQESLPAPVAASLSSSPGPGMAHSSSRSINAAPITLDQLNDILLKINVEILRLS